MKNNFALLLLLFSLNSFSQNFYVDGTSGNNGNSGTALNQAWKTIQHAFDFAVPGSTVYIRGGTYNENVNANVTGTPGNVITYRNYQNETVILDGTGTAQPDLLYIEDQSYITIQNITIRNKVVNYATGVVISCTAGAAATNITLKNLKISGINWTSNASTTPTSNDNSNPLLIYGQGTNQANAITNIIIDSCEVYNNITGFSESISLDGNIDSFVVSNNKVHDNTNIGILMAGNYQVSTNAAMDHTRNGHCFQNTCYNNVSNYATSGGIYIDGGKNIVIERNTSYGNGYGIEIGCEEDGSTDNITVRDNAIYNNKEAGLAIGGYTAATTGQVLNSNILNNTFLKDDYSNSGVGELYISKMSNCKIQNNIFYTNAQNILLSKDNISPQSNNVINYNCWYSPNNNSSSITVNWGASTYTSFSNYVSQTGMDANSIYADPKLTVSTVASPDLHLLNTSTCIEAGNPAFIVASGETDYYGNPRLTGPKVDIGASEYSVGNWLNENESGTSWNIYPNPFSETATLQILNDGRKINYELQLYDVIGKEVKKLMITNQVSEIQRGELENGLYFYKLLSGKELVGTGKIIIR